MNKAYNKHLIKIIIGFIIMLYRILRIAKSSETLTGSLLAYGTFSLITAHLLVNLLGVMAVIPLTGVPLPFISYGGSFTICLIAALTIVQRVSVETGLAKEGVHKNA